MTDVFERVIVDPEVTESGGKRCEVSVLFAELRGHLSFAQKAPPEQIIVLLNDYLKLAADEPERWLVIDAEKSREEIAEKIWQRVSPLLPGQKRV